MNCRSACGTDTSRLACKMRSQSGRRDTLNQSRFQAVAQPLLQARNFARDLVRGEHDLMPLGVQRVEGMEKFFLGALAPRQELDIVEDQRVHAAKFLPEL